MAQAVVKYRDEAGSIQQHTQSFDTKEEAAQFAAQVVESGVTVTGITGASKVYGQIVVVELSA